jgi:hypothetical protein
MDVNESVNVNENVFVCSCLNARQGAMAMPRRIARTSPCLVNCALFGRPVTA